ncbi:MAG: enoyl-CoA hydratase/isomerase family protein [Alphaproteobacteria bacterium]|nr:enoyl-CoA hydratase/isomerase family protein [Alphaproteobacteria bacterium]
MKLTNFTYDKDADGIVTLTMDMPGRSMNVLSASSTGDLAAAIKAIAGDESVKGVVITSGKPAFLAGADLSELGAGGGGGARTEEARKKAVYEQILAFNMMLRQLETMGKPVVAAINGTALGGGLELTLACHYRLVADDPKIQLGLPESKVGVMPGGGGTQRLPRLIGPAAALPLMLQGTASSPAEALKLGIVHKVVPADRLVAEAKAWIRGGGEAVQPWDRKGFDVPGGGPYSRGNSQTFVIGNAMLRKETNGNFPAQANILKAVYEGIQVPIEAGLRIESRYMTDLLLNPQSRAMIRSLFLSMQELGKGARRPAGVPETRVRKIAVLGAGLMGAGVAYVSARAGIDVVLIDRDQAAADKGKDYSVRLLDKDIERGRTTAAKKEELLNRIHPSTDYAGLSDVDLVIEAVFEDRAIKADVTAKAEAVMPKGAVFGSNTSTLPITGLAEASQRPEDFIGVHFFSPVERMGLVEIIMGARTSDAALARAIDYVKAIRKTPIVVNDARGFYTSRCFGTYTREGLAMVSEGIHPALVENVGRMAGMPMGPLEVSDSVGLDTALKIGRAAAKDLGINAADDRENILAWIVEEKGRVGRKAGKGFYQYTEKGRTDGLWPELLASRREGWNSEADPAELRRRLLYIQSLETVRCLEEGVLTDVRDADVGSILGWGFAPWSGGTLSLIDIIGTRRFVAECDELAARHGARFSPPSLLREMAEKGETFYGRFAGTRDAA